MFLIRALKRSCDVLAVLAISSCERTHACACLWIGRLRVNVTLDRHGKSFVARGGEKKWQGIKAEGSDLMESVDIVTVNHSKENTEIRRSTQPPLTSSRPYVWCKDPRWRIVFACNAFLPGQRQKWLGTREAFQPGSVRLRLTAFFWTVNNIQFNNRDLMV